MGRRPAILILAIALLSSARTPHHEEGSRKHVVILVHGILGNAGSMANFERPVGELARVVNYQYASTTDTIQNHATGLADTIRRESAGDVEITIVAHSMGGLISREVIESGRYDMTKVKTLVMLGTPNHGSPLADDLVVVRAMLTTNVRELLDIPEDIQDAFCPVKQEKRSEKWNEKLAHLSSSVKAKASMDILNGLTLMFGDRAALQLNTFSSGYINGTLNKRGLNPNVRYIAIAGVIDSLLAKPADVGEYGGSGSDGVVPAKSVYLDDLNPSPSQYKSYTVDASHTQLHESSEVISLVVKEGIGRRDRNDGLIKPNKILDFRIALRDDYAGIRVMNTDGSWANISMGAVPYFNDIAWSPDGTKIAFSCDRTLSRWDDKIKRYVEENGESGIYVMNQDGSGLNRLVIGPVSFPTWSSDGTMLAFMIKNPKPLYGIQTVDYGLHVVHSDGSGFRKLTEGLCFGPPAWSPDGKKIAAVCEKNNRRGIYLINSDASGQEYIADTKNYVSSLSWSPDGKMIAFASDSEGIDMVNADGSGRRPVSKMADSNRPSWSPDGSKIAFFHEYTVEYHGNYRVFAYELYVANANGIDKPKLISRDFTNNVSWSSNGTKIAFTAVIDERVQVHVLNSDGSGRKEVIETMREHVGPVGFYWTK